MPHSSLFASSILAMMINDRMSCVINLDFRLVDGNFISITKDRSNFL